MALVTLNEFNTYSNNFESDNDLVAMKNDIIEAASDIVIDFLGFNPECGLTREMQVGIGSNVIYTEAKPIKCLHDIIIDGVEKDVNDFYYKDGMIGTKNGCRVFKTGSDIYLSYVAGYDNVPSIIKMATLRIASLMLLETNGNIGLSGRTFADQSRSYINYSNYDKYLQPLSYLKTRIL